MLEHIKLLVYSRMAALWLVSYEEVRVEMGLARIASGMAIEASKDDGIGQHKGNVAVWSLTGNGAMPGWCQPDGWPGQKIPASFVKDPKVAAKPHTALLAACEYALEHPREPWILIVRDAHVLLKDAAVRRAIKDCSRRLRNTWTTLVCVSCSAELPDDLKHDIITVRPGLPKFPVLQRYVGDTIRQFNIRKAADKEETYNPDKPADKKALSNLISASAEALKGLGVAEACDVVVLDVKKHGGHIDPQRLSKAKAKRLAQVDGVTFKADAGSLDDVGSMDLLKPWLAERKDGFSPEAEAFGLKRPRGILTVGIPGCGKTLVARAIAAYFGLPLIELNLSACEGSLVGETAQRLMLALETADALSPCVVLIDEVEKALGSGLERDGGSKSTLLRLLLTWMQDRTSDVFVCMTANDISGLPPEFSRAGRIDEMWFVDLPSLAARQEILEIHLRKRRDRSLPAKEIKTLAEELKDYTGAELEKAVESALWRAFKRLREGGDGTVTADDIRAGASAIVPMAETYEEKLTFLRQWARGRARFASTPDELTPPSSDDKARASEAIARIDPFAVVPDEDEALAQW